MSLKDQISKVLAKRTHLYLQPRQMLAKIRSKAAPAQKVGCHFVPNPLESTKKILKIQIICFACGRSDPDVEPSVVGEYVRSLRRNAILPSWLGLTLRHLVAVNKLVNFAQKTD